MNNDELRNAGENIAAAMNEAAEKIKQGMERTGHILTVQGALGWAYRGDLTKARQVLEKLPVDKLVELSAAAAALSSLADEVAAAKS